MNILSARFRHSAHNVWVWNLFAIWWVSSSLTTVKWMLGWPTCCRFSCRPLSGSSHTMFSLRLQIKRRQRWRRSAKREWERRKKKKSKFPSRCVLCEECFSCWADRREDTSKLFSYFVFGWKRLSKERNRRLIVFAVIGETLIVSEAIATSQSNCYQRKTFLLLKRRLLALFGRWPWTGWRENTREPSKFEMSKRVDTLDIHL